MNRQAWIAWLIIFLQAVLFWYLSETTVFPAFVLAISLPAVIWRHRWEISPVQLPLVDLVLAVLCTLKWFFAPYQPPSVIGFVLYDQMHAAGQFFLLAQVARLWSRRTGRPLPVYLPLLAVLVFICLGDMDVTRRQRRMFEWATLALVGLTALYYSTSRRREVHGSTSSWRWARPTLVVAVFVVAGWGARLGNAWVLRRWTELEQMLMQVTAARERVPRTDKFVGFSQHATLDSVKLLKTNAENDVALRVVSENFPGYLRGRIFNQFAMNGWEWRVDMFERPALPLDSPWHPHRAQASANSHVFALRPVPAEQQRVMTVWRDDSLESFLFVPATGNLLQAVTSAPSLAMDKHGQPSGDKLLPSTSYTVWHTRASDPPHTEPILQPQACEPTLPFAIDSNDAAAAREVFLQVPDGLSLSRQLASLVDEIFAECRTDREKIDAVKRYFAAHYHYHPGLVVPAEWEHDPLTYFLLRRPAAHCEYFASGTTILLRMAGVPCRYVSGFAGGELQELAGYWIVRHSDAHAWAEAYLPDEGWVLVETTPGDGVPLGRSTFSLWYLLDEISLRGQMIREALTQGGLRGWWRALTLFAFTLLTTVPGWMLTGGMIFLLVRQIRPRRSARHSILEPPEVRDLQHLRRTLDRLLRSLRLERAEHETLHQFARRLRGLPDGHPDLLRAAAWYETYAHARYNSAERDPAVLTAELHALTAGLRNSRWRTPFKSARPTPSDESSA